VTHTNSSCRRNRKAFFSFSAGAWIVALASGMLVSTIGQALAATYLLGPLDVLKIRVFEWRPSAGIAYEWVPLTGEFTVSASGTLSLPIVGTIPVAGKTPEEVSEIIGEPRSTPITDDMPDRM